jgi:translation initiation factor 1A
VADLKKSTSKTKSEMEKTVAGVRTPRIDNNEILATVESLLGANRLRLRCMDGIVRMGRIPGSMKKKTWIREGDIVIIVPWEFQNEKANVIWKYTRPQIEWLQRKGYLKGFCCKKSGSFTKPVKNITNGIFIYYKQVINDTKTIIMVPLQKILSNDIIE